MKTLARAALLLALAWSHDALAAGSCSILSPTSGSTLLNFGDYSVLGGNDDQTATITLVCVPDILTGLAVSYAVSIDAGTGSGGSFNPRKLKSGGYALTYNIFRDASRTLIWGDGSAGAAKVTGSCSATCVLTTYGRVFSGQGVPSGSYSDSVMVTLEF